MKTLRNHDSGMTLIEVLVASFIALVFVLAAGTGYLVNQKSFAANREKLELQQQASLVMEIMEKKIREAGRAVIPNPNRLQLYESYSTPINNYYTYFRLAASGSTTKLFEQTTVLARQQLINLQFIPNSDTTVVQIVLNLEDKNKNRVALRASAALRNHPKLRAATPLPS